MKPWGVLGFSPAAAGVPAALVIGVVTTGAAAKATYAGVVIASITMFMLSTKGKR